MGANYERGILLYQSKQFKYAEKEFRQEILNNPRSASAHAMLGMTLTALRKADQGHKEALESVALLPNYSYGHYTLSFTFAALNKPKEAEKAIVEAIRLTPDEAYLFARASQIYFAQKNYPKSLDMADHGLACDPEHEECLIDRGACLLEMNKLAEAEEVIGRALAIAPESSTAHINAGAVYLRKFDHVKAFEHYREALRLNPSSEQARTGVVESLKAKNKLYHGLLWFSLWCRRMPPWGVACCLVLIVIPPTRFVLVAFLGLYAFANYIFNMALHLDPVGKTFISEKQKEHLEGLKVSRVPLVMVTAGLTLSICAALFPHQPLRHSADATRKLVHDEPIDAVQFNEYGKYMEFIQRRIKNHWNPPQNVPQSSRSVVHYLVNRNGTVDNIKMKLSSGDADLDKADIAAIKEAAPFPKLPPGKEKYVEVEFTFDYNVHNKPGMHKETNSVHKPDANLPTSYRQPEKHPTSVEQNPNSTNMNNAADQKQSK